LSVPAHNGPTEASIAAAVPKWYEFSERLFADEHGDLDEHDLDDAESGDCYREGTRDFSLDRGRNHAAFTGGRSGLAIGARKDCGNCGKSGRSERVPAA
jgi:hypothetical protein